MRKLILLVVLLFFNTLSQFVAAQDHDEFADELSRDQISMDALNAICYQDVRRIPFKRVVKNSTSFFISKNCLLTSAHNVTRLPFHSAKHITIYPSRIRNEKPFDSIYFQARYRKRIKYPNRYCYFLPWTRKKHDMALVYIPDNIINSNQHLGNIQPIQLWMEPESLKIGDTIYCAGYPAKGKYGGEYIMTMDTSVISGIHKNYFTHHLETLPGNSGSPIMIKRDGTFYAIGVNSIHLRGTWLDSGKLALISRWKNLLERRNL